MCDCKTATTSRLPRVSGVPEVPVLLLLVAALLVLLQVVVVPSTADSVAERSALYDLWWATNGTGWRSTCRLTGWSTFMNSSAPLPSVCDLSTSPFSSFSRITCSRLDGNVTNVRLNACNLVGTLPASLSSLTEASVFQLFDNALTGTLPPSWSSLTKLTYLRLQGNKFNGTLPPSWSAMTNLLGFYVDDSALTGSLPPQYSAWSRIQFFQLANNRLNGTLPRSYGALSTLQGLELQRNFLTGTVPAEWAAGMSNLLTSWYCNATCVGVVGIDATCTGDETNRTCRRIALWYNCLSTVFLPPFVPTNPWNWVGGSVFLGFQRSSCAIPARTASVTPSGARSDSVSLRPSRTDSSSLSGSSWSVPLTSSASSTLHVHVKPRSLSRSISASASSLWYSSTVTPTTVSSSNVVSLSMSLAPTHSSTVRATVSALLPSTATTTTTVTHQLSLQHTMSVSSTPVASTSQTALRTVSVGRTDVASRTISMTATDDGATKTASGSFSLTESAAVRQQGRALLQPLRRNTAIVVTTAASATAASLVAGAAVVSTGLQRALLQTTLSQCGAGNSEQEAEAAADVAPLDGASSPLQLSVGPQKGAYIRGSIIGNLGLLAALGLISFVVVTVHSKWWWSDTHRRDVCGLFSPSSLWRSAARMKLPGLLHIPVVFLMQPIVSGSVWCVRSGADEWQGDPILGAVGLALAAGYTAWATWICTAGCPAVCRATKPTRLRQDHDLAGGGGGGVLPHWVALRVWSLIPPVVRRCLFGWTDGVRFHWIAPTGRSSSSSGVGAHRCSSSFSRHFVACFEYLLCEYRSHRSWFVLIDLTMVIGSGILSGLALTEEDSSVCSVLSVFFLVQLALFLGCLCVLQPYSEALAHSVNVLLTLLGLLWAVLNEIPSARDSTFFQSLPEVQMWVSVVMVGTAFIVLLVEGKWYRHWRWIWSSCGCSSCGSRRRKRIRRRRRSSGRDSLPHPHQHHSNIINHDSSSSSSSHSRRSSDDEEEEEDDDDDGVYDEEFAITVASTFSLAQQRSLEYLVQTICQQQQQQQQQQTLNRSEEIDEKADDGGASPPSALI